MQQCLARREGWAGAAALGGSEQFLPTSLAVCLLREPWLRLSDLFLP